MIYQGPHVGIHTDWGTTEAFCKVDKVTCRKFPSEASARLSIAIYQEEASKTTVLLRPKQHKARDQRFIVPQDVQHEVNNPPISFEEFRTLWGKARAACPKDLIHEKLYTTDKKNKSLYNFIEGADPNLIYKASSAGLVNNIYPSCNLQELMFFPRSMVEAIKTFRKKVLKAKDEPIYIRCISSLPQWIHEATMAPSHFLENWPLKSQKRN